MKKEYDFSKGERGKFCHADVQEFVLQFAEKSKRNTTEVVNEMLRRLK